MNVDKIQEYTDAYLESYMRALDKTHNSDLAAQVAFGVTSAIALVLGNQDQKKTEPQPQEINQGALLAAMFANMASQQTREDAGNESDDDE